jgi:hypothetical protein
MISADASRFLEVYTKILHPWKDLSLSLRVIANYFKNEINMAKRNLIE